VGTSGRGKSDGVGASGGAEGRRGEKKPGEGLRERGMKGVWWGPGNEMGGGEKERKRGEG